MGFTDDIIKGRQLKLKTLLTQDECLASFECDFPNEWT